MLQYHQGWESALVLDAVYESHRVTDGVLRIVATIPAWSRPPAMVYQVDSPASSFTIDNGDGLLRCVRESDLV